jgi:hypothetical protein
MNPYRSGGLSPTLIERTKVVELVEILQDPSTDQGLVLLGGHGSGKSTALTQIERALSQETGVVVRRLTDTWPTEDGCHIELYRALGMTPEPVLPSGRLAIEAWLAAHPLDRLVLLFDEFGARLPDAGRNFFGVIEAVRKEHTERLKVVLAGGIQVLRFQMDGGSPYWSRARRKVLPPFDAAELARLAGPFKEPLSPDVLDAIRVSTGGNAFLVTHVLQRLWAAKQPRVEDVYRILEDRERLISFQETFQRALEVHHPQHPIPRLWNELVSNPGPHDLEAIEALCRASTPNDIPVSAVLLFLEASGLLHQEQGALTVNCRLIHSILQPRRLPDRRRDGESLQQRLDRTLERILLEIHSSGPDYYREAKKLVPEAVFAAVICTSLRLLGWDAEREALRGEGRIDVLARHADFPDDRAVIEVKIWGRNDYEAVGEQVAGYLHSGVTAFAPIMVTDLAKVDDWPERYQEKCLRPGTWQRMTEVNARMAGYYRARVVTPDGVQVEVSHLLLRVPSGTR